MSKKHLSIIGIIIIAIIASILFINSDLTNNLSESESKAPHINEVTRESNLTEPNFKNVSVHDPSIIKVDDLYYVFGTHIEAAKSEDLIDWTLFTNGYKTPDNALYDNLSENLAQSFEWAGENDADSYGGFSVWAPEIFWNEYYVNEDGSTGAYMIYYSASSTYIRSAIGFAVSQNIEGPYQHVDTLVYSGFTNYEAYDKNSEVNKYWENTHIPNLIEQGILTSENDDWFDHNGEYNNRDFPNAIDANLFFDSDDRLWMSYGSWSGGIFLLELDAETGTAIYPGEDGETNDGRMIDRYFGTKISGGYAKSGEGPYVQYNPNNNYFYLYVTYGWLGADGGYHVRQFRSENPDGPYLDADDQPAVLPGDVNHAQYGNKLFGNFVFKRELGEAGMGHGVGYLSPGHNSVFLDEETGEEFLVFHTRFPNRGEAHELRIHQMFLNKNDWPVVSPKRYAGEQLDDQLSKDDLVGDYKYINHGKDNSPELKETRMISLHDDGTITGAIEGNWSHDGYYATITVNNIDYDGVFVEVWDDVQQEAVMSFTALSNKGVTVWGVQSSGSKLTAEEIVNNVKQDLSVGNPNNVTSNLDLVDSGFAGTTITWESSNKSVISDKGEVIRPVGDDETVILLATIKNAEATETKEFEITVSGKREVELTAHYSFDNNLSDSVGKFADGQATGERIDDLNGEITFTDGVVGQAAKFDGSSGIRLPDQLIEQDTYSISLWLYPEALTQHTTSFFGAASQNKWMSLVPHGHNDETIVWAGSDEWYDAATGILINTHEWSHLVVTVEGGNITIYLNGELGFEGNQFPNLFSGNETYFSLGVNHWDPPFQGLMDELMIYDGVLSSSEITALYQQ